MLYFKVRLPLLTIHRKPGMLKTAAIKAPRVQLPDNTWSCAIITEKTRRKLGIRKEDTLVDLPRRLFGSSAY